MSKTIIDLILNLADYRNKDNGLEIKEGNKMAQWKHKINAGHSSKRRPPFIYSCGQWV